MEWFTNLFYPRQPVHPTTNTQQTKKSEAEVPRVTPISTRDLKSAVDLARIQTVEELQSTASVVGTTWQHFAQNGFAVFQLDQDARQLLAQMPALRSAVRHYFALKLQQKEELLQVFKGENRGYVLIPKLREYIKLRLEDVKERVSLAPGEHEQKETFESVFTVMFEGFFQLLWSVYLHLYHAERVKQLAVDKHAQPLLDESQLEDTRQCLYERSFVSMIHYFAGGLLEDEIEPDTYSTGGGSADQRRCVCATHTDTGLLTGIMCASVTGLEVLYRDTQWIPIEQVLHQLNDNSSHEYLVVIMGEKAPMFTASQHLKPTKHRVVIDPQQERESLLFFMDTAKAT
eukprot:TRINITY_DN1299_c1_g1_i1.p1 TRINITY_DN1299_c1_g1~~TRINITY_DN1299_c1_g1_i1.p1  ORF type:complete len:344 (-),score=57.51 TRINITY_DN1299_c1_g1_i1:1064-2095(-)